MERNQWESAAEAILFALGEPVEETRLAQAMGCPREAAARACQSLAQGYEAEQAGVRLVRLEESWQLVSAPQWGETIRGLLSRRKPDKLSPAALETLAVVAYFQPVTRVVIDQVFLRSFGLSSLEELPPLPESGLNREEGQPW